MKYKVVLKVDWEGYFTIVVRKSWHLGCALTDGKEAEVN